MKKQPKIVSFPNPVELYAKENKNIIAEVMTITPDDAAKWLACNTHNRPLRKRHVEFIAREILEGNWQLNGQAIVIADDEQVLDGQHRLSGIIMAGKPIQTLVVYGITPDAFKTMDTGAVRSGADALCLYFPDQPANAVKAVATAVQWCSRLEGPSIHARMRLSNTDVIGYASAHMSLFAHHETLVGYPRDARPMSLGMGTALAEMFTRKSEPQAEQFMRRLFTGEELVRTDPEYLLRAAFIRDAEKAAKLPDHIRMRMVIKAWNWRRRGNTEATRHTIYVQSGDDPKVRFF